MDGDHTDHAHLRADQDLDHQGEERTQALHAREARLLAALAAGETGSWRYDPAADQDLLDPSMAHLIGLPPEEAHLSLEGFLACVHPDDRDRVRSAFVGALRGGDKVELEFRVVWPDGSVHWLMDRGRVLDGPTGGAPVLTGTAMEITSRKRAEAALRESEERYRAIVEQATDYAIFTTDAERRIDGWPAGTQAVLGGTEAEMVGQLMDVTYTPEDQAAGVPAAEFATARETGSAPNVRWHLRQDGARVFIDGVARARHGEDGTFTGILKIGQDVTERRLAVQRRREAEEQARQQLEERVFEATAELRALSRRLLLVQEDERRRLALELHDEVGQMLTGLGLQLAAIDTPNVRLEEARRSVTALTEQVRQMSMDLRPPILDQYGLLATITQHLTRYQQRTGIFVDLRHEGLGERRFALAVEIAAYRIVQEALTNVARHSGAMRAVVQFLADSQVLTLSIRDEGGGSNLARMTGGSGLAGMRERAELLGGTLTVDAAVGEGVTVTAELPLAGDATGTSREDELD